MAVAAALLHDNLALANPLTVLTAIGQIGWDFVMPCVVGGVRPDRRRPAPSGPSCSWSRRSGSPSWRLWGFWVFAFYAAMVVFRMVGLTYHAHAPDLVWFSGRPRWGLPRLGNIYGNS